MVMDVLSWSHQNLRLSRAGELVVREGQEHAYTNATMKGGFSVRSPNTGEVWHYILTRSSGGLGGILVRDEDFDSVTGANLYNVPSDFFVTHATISSPHVSSLEMIIGGPDIPTMYGFAGGGFIVAEAQEDEDPNTTAIDVPRGIVAGFAGRAVIANGKNIYFSNGYGTRVVDGVATFTGPRTYTPVNIGDLAATIYGLHTSEQGALLIVTDAGVWGLPPQAVASGVQVRDLFEKISDYQATGYQQTALSRGKLWGLSSRGVVIASDRNLPEIPLDEPRHPRELSEPIEVADYRNLRIWPTADGVVVSQPHALCEIDDVRGFRSWHTHGGGQVSYDVLGVLTEADGRPLFVSPTRAWGYHGWDLDGNGNGSAPVGVAAGALQVPPEGSVVVRDVTTSSDTPGNQKASVRGSTARSKATPQAGAIIGTDTWSATEQYEERAIRSRRHRFQVRTDDPTVEIAAEHAGSRLGLVDVAFRGQGRKRP